ncbi:acyltransferase [Enterobacter asburiae]|uniref:acyltransferase n=1 Tax=Enterobacter asburiae TaxID=61645 RepID=UPI00192A87FC|nr:acyltransferase [Enterobacter asburiae]MBL5950321.1 acyltransferase [Enterobacter asburiae]
MPYYKSISINKLNNKIISLSDSVSFSGEPDIKITLVADSINAQKEMSEYDFYNTIQIDDNTWVDSIDHLAFHSGKTKITSVKVNSEKAGKIVIGKRVVLQGTAIISYNSITIEDDVIFGPNVTLMDSSGHPLSNRGTKDEASRITSAPVLIKNNAWIGINCIILKGVTIGSHAVIGAGSVVNIDIPDYAIAVGNPAKVIRYISRD